MKNDLIHALTDVAEDLAADMVDFYLREDFARFDEVAQCLTRAFMVLQKANAQVPPILDFIVEQFGFLELSPQAVLYEAAGHLTYAVTGYYEPEGDLSPLRDSPSAQLLARASKVLQEANAQVPENLTGLLEDLRDTSDHTPT